ncbi:MAG: hypothetical protein E4H21_01020 [Thermodesulfobacteriales bacterium]|nr:MAG: hypothetical protein E4H21_01020 [Thermodesulfobacteriales bacterium]
MIIARWQFQAKLGQKGEAIKSITKWYDEIGSQIGWSLNKVRIVTGSVGASEALVECEIQIKDMKELDASWAKLATIKKLKTWAKQFGKYIISGSTKWDFYRAV